MNREICDKIINQVVFEKCDDILVGDMLHFEWLDDVNMQMGIKAIGRILRNEFTTNYQFTVKGNPKTVFLFSNSYRDRNDLKLAFEKVCGTTDDYICFIASSYQIAKGVNSLYLTPKWIKKFMQNDFSLWEALYYTSILHEAYTDHYRMTRVLQEENVQVKNFVSLCDVMAIDSYCTQWWNLHDVNTITLQHGTYNVFHYGYTHLKSNYLLVHSPFSYNTAVTSGVDPNRLFVVGAPQNIKNHALMKSGEKKRIIGLIFGGTVLEKYDIELLLLVKKFAIENNFEIYIKLHPGFGIEMYEEGYLLEEYRLINDDMNVYAFSELVDVVIDDGSTVFVELSVIGKKALTYTCEKNPYREDKKIQMKFSNYEEFCTLFWEVYNDTDYYHEMQRKNMEYLGTVNDPADYYKSFFREKLQK